MNDNWEAADRFFCRLCLILFAVSCLSVSTVDWPFSLTSVIACACGVRACVRACVCVCVRARACVCVCVCVCVRERERGRERDWDGGCRIYMPLPPSAHTHPFPIPAPTHAVSSPSSDYGLASADSVPAHLSISPWSVTETQSVRSSTMWDRLTNPRSCLSADLPPPRPSGPRHCNASKRLPDSLEIPKGTGGSARSCPADRVNRLHLKYPGEKLRPEQWLMTNATQCHTATLINTNTLFFPREPP